MIWISVTLTAISRRYLIELAFSMDDKESIVVLKEIMAHYPLSEREVEAVHSAIGVLSLAAIAEGRIKKLGERQRAHRHNSTK